VDETSLIYLNIRCVIFDVIFLISSIGPKISDFDTYYTCSHLGTEKTRALLLNVTNNTKTITLSQSLEHKSQEHVDDWAQNM